VNPANDTGAPPPPPLDDDATNRIIGRPPNDAMLSARSVLLTPHAC
jgi:hypothetical protein